MSKNYYINGLSPKGLELFFSFQWKLVVWSLYFMNLLTDLFGKKCFTNPSSRLLCYISLPHSETCNLQLELWISQYITNDNSKKNVLSSMRNLICITIWPFFKRAPHPPDFTINWRYKIRSCYYILVISEILSWDFLFVYRYNTKNYEQFFSLLILSIT